MVPFALTNVVITKPEQSVKPIFFNLTQLIGSPKGECWTTTNKCKLLAKKYRSPKGRNASRDGLV